MDDDHPVEDPHDEHPVARVLRPAFHPVVEAFRAGDYGLRTEIPMVAPLRPEVPRQIEEYIADYGEAIVSLPAETWLTSVSQWMEGHWNVLVDLWTESGRSDMVIDARVRRGGASYSIEIWGVYVP